MYGDIQFGIVIPTYYRKDGSTWSTLTKTLTSVKQQSYENWKIILVGDDYEDKGEFKLYNDIIPKEKMVAINLDRSVERDFYYDKIEGDDGELILEKIHDLWCVAGSTASNFGIQVLKDLGINYFCQLDHDDIWYNNHLKLNYDAYTKFGDIDFTYSKALVGTTYKFHCPPFEGEKTFYKNKVLPCPGGIIHSTTTCNLNTYKLNFPEFKGAYFDVMGRKFCPKEWKQPSDHFKWTHFPDEIAKNNLNYIYINTATCHHEGESISKLKSGKYLKNKL